MNPKDQAQFGAGAISVKDHKGDFIALVLNGGLVDSSWSNLADSAGIRTATWWVFKIPTSNVSVEDNKSIISSSKVKSYGFENEIQAIEKFDSMSDSKIDKITPKVLKDKEL